MQCGLCQHEWCWSCGFERRHIIHLIQSGIQCEFWNLLFSKSKDNILVKIVIASLAIALSPLIVFFVLLGTIWYGSAVVFNYSCCRYTKNSGLHILNYVGSLIVCLIIGPVVYGILFVPFILFIVFYVVNSIKRWCVETRKIQTTQIELDI